MPLDAPIPFATRLEAPRPKMMSSCPPHGLEKIGGNQVDAIAIDFCNTACVRMEGVGANNGRVYLEIVAEPAALSARPGRVIAPPSLLSSPLVLCSA